MAFFTKVLYKANQDISSWDILFVSGGLATGLLWINARIERVNLVNFDNYCLSLVIGVLFMVLCYIFQILSLEYISVAKSALIIYSNPILVVVLAYFFFKENVTKYDLATVILVLIGCYLVISNSGDSKEHQDSNYGYILAALSCISMGLSVLLLRQVNQ